MFVVSVYGVPDLFGFHLLELGVCACVRALEASTRSILEALEMGRGLASQSQMVQV